MCILCVFRVYSRYSKYIRNTSEIHSKYIRNTPKFSENVFLCVFPTAFCYIHIVNSFVFRCIPLFELLSLRLLLLGLLVLQCRPDSLPKAAFLAPLSAHAPTQLAYI